MASKKQDTSAITVEETVGALALDDFGEFAGDGFQDVTKDDLKTPFIKQLQGLSPEVAESTVEGAKPGMFFNTATSELISMEPGFLCLPIEKQHHFVEWKSREAGGGFVATHKPDSDFVKKTFAHMGQKFGKLTTPDGNELIESHDMFLMLLDETGFMPTGDAAIFSFTSTKINALRDWYTKMYTVKVPRPAGAPPPMKNGKPLRPPMYAFRSRICGFKDPKTNKGVFFNVAVKPFVEGSWLNSIVRPNQERELLETARGFYDMFHAGDLKPDYQAQTAPSETTVGGESVPF